MLGSSTTWFGQKRALGVSVKIQIKGGSAINRVQRDMAKHGHDQDYEYDSLFLFTEKYGSNTCAFISTALNFKLPAMRLRNHSAKIQPQPISACFALA